MGALAKTAAASLRLDHFRALPAIVTTCAASFASSRRAHPNHQNGVSRQFAHVGYHWNPFRSTRHRSSYF